MTKTCDCTDECHWEPGVGDCWLETDMRSTLADMDPEDLDQRTESRWLPWAAAILVSLVLWSALIGTIWYLGWRG